MNPNHPSRLVAPKGRWLAGRRVWLAVTGSVAAVEAVQLARELLRYGAEVRIAASPAALELVGEKALEFSSGHPVLTDITGQVEHVLAGAEADLLLLAPCSASSLAKVVHGIGDTPPTLLALSCLGHTPVLLAPAMDGRMTDSSVVQANLTRAREIATVLDPLVEEGKAKLPPRDAIAAAACHLAGPGTLRGRRVLVIGGATAEPVDAVRVLTNRSSGRMAVALAEAAYAMGADTELWLGCATATPGSWLPRRRFTTLADLRRMVAEMDACDTVLLPAALADFIPQPRRGKVVSAKGWTLKLEPAEKLLPLLRERHAGVLMAFKLETDVSDDELIKRARRHLSHADAVAANHADAMEADAGRLALVTTGGAEWHAGSKPELAQRLLAWTATTLRDD